MRCFFFNGYSRYEMGLIVEEKSIRSTPRPDFELISVPGRDMIPLRCKSSCGKVSLIRLTFVRRLPPREGN